MAGLIGILVVNRLLVGPVFPLTAEGVSRDKVAFQKLPPSVSFWLLVLWPYQWLCE